MALVGDMACRCGCGASDMDKRFLRHLGALAGHLHFDLVVSSGFRCPEHNELVAGTGRDGPHTRGVAVDIAISGWKAAALLRYAMILGFRGVGLMQSGAERGRFIHLDDDDSRHHQTIWTY